MKEIMKTLLQEKIEQEKPVPMILQSENGHRFSVTNKPTLVWLTWASKTTHNTPLSPPPTWAIHLRIDFPGVAEEILRQQAL